MSAAFISVVSVLSAEGATSSSLFRILIISSIVFGSPGLLSEVSFSFERTGDYSKWGWITCGGGGGLSTGSDSFYFGSSV